MKKLKNTRKKKSNQKKLSSKEKKAYIIVGLSIFTSCVVLFTISFFLLPYLSDLNKQSSQTQIFKNKPNLSETKTTSKKNPKTSNKQPTQNKARTKKIHPIKNEPNPNKTKTTSKQKPKSDAIKAVPNTSKPQKPQTKKIGTLFFVFDDAGHNLFQLEPFLKLPFKCTFAVLPGLPNSKSASQKIRDAGHDVILHQPMQALNLNLDPGPQAIIKDMSADEVRNIVTKNLDEIAPVIGMNNHEGSLITTDKNIMHAILQVVKKKNIFFLDSRTNSQTVVPEVANDLQMQILERNIFIDNFKSKNNMRHQIETGMQYATKHGRAILIGHVFTTALAELLQEMHAEILASGFSLAGLSEWF